MKTGVRTYQGSCHCGAIRFEFEAPEIDSGVRCNCSICRRKGIMMSSVLLSSETLRFEVDNDALGTYQFGSQVAKHHFCKKCGISPFHETLRAPGSYRVNLGCVDGVDSLSLPYELFDGASL